MVGCGRRALAIAACVAVSTACGWASADTTEIVVSQKGRKFNPNAVELAQGGALIVVNDDGDLLHHAYIESDSFSFDSGDQQPGSRTRIVFPVSGRFMILCGIHPKMKLAVRVK